MSKLYTKKQNKLISYRGPITILTNGEGINMYLFIEGSDVARPLSYKTKNIYFFKTMSKTTFSILELRSNSNEILPVNFSLSVILLQLKLTKLKL